MNTQQRSDHRDNGGDMPALTCIGFGPFRKGKLRGFADLHIPSWHCRIFTWPVFEGPEGISVAMPSRKIGDASRAVFGYAPHAFHGPARVIDAGDRFRAIGHDQRRLDL